MEELEIDTKEHVEKSRRAEMYTNMVEDNKTLIEENTKLTEEIKKQTGKDARILLANTEQKRGYYYANEFLYDIVDIDAPHNPEKYVELIFMHA